MKKTIKLLLCACGLLASACGSSDEFTITGSLAGGGTHTVRLLYADGSTVKTLSAVSTNGKFMLQGRSTVPALAFLTTSRGEPLATLIVRNGDDIKVEADAAKRYGARVSGSSASKALAEFMAENAGLLTTGSSADINSAVAEFVKDKRNSAAATAAMVTLFQTPGNEVACDSLLGLIAPEVRGSALMQNFNAALTSQLSAESRADITGMSLRSRKDTLVSFNPYRYHISLLAFVSDNKASRDSVLPMLRRLRAAAPHSRLEIIEINGAPDSATWRGVTAGDSATWPQVWLPGSVSSPSLRKLSVPRFPFFIVTDSTGQQLLRTPGVAAASRFVTDHL